MRESLKRLAALETTAEVIKKKRRMHDPFIVYRPWSFLKDQFYLEYHPEGLFRKPEKIGPLTYAEVVEKMKTYPRNLLCDIDLSRCTEWLFCFHCFGEQSRLYTEDQIEHFVQKDLEESPELAALLPGADGDMLDLMLKLPQTIVVSIDTLLQAAKNERSK